MGSAAAGHDIEAGLVCSLAVFMFINGFFARDNPHLTKTWLALKVTGKEESNF